MSAEIRAQGFLLNRPYAVDKRMIIKTRATAINICREELDCIRANSLSSVMILIISTSAAAANSPPRKLKIIPSVLL